MKKIGLFLMVGFAFTVLQVGIVYAQNGSKCGKNQNAWCTDSDIAASQKGQQNQQNQGNPNQTGPGGTPPMGMNSGMPPMGMNSGMPPMGNQGMPPGTAGMPPMGDNSMMPPMGISGEITYCEEFSDQPKKRGEVNCLRDLLDQTPLSETVRHAKKGKKRGFYKCGSKDRAQHVGCLRDLLKGQNDKPGMAPGTN